MTAREYLKEATGNTEAGDRIFENNLTEAVIKIMEGYANFSKSLPTCHKCGNKVTTRVIVTCKIK